MKYMFFFSFLFLLGCGSDDDQELSACLDEKLEEFKTHACEGTGDLTLWEFNGREVYCFNPGSCVADGAIEIYEYDCTHVCTMGTIAGISECEGLDWATNAEFIETLYAH